VWIVLHYAKPEEKFVFIKTIKSKKYDRFVTPIYGTDEVFCRFSDSDEEVKGFNEFSSHLIEKLNIENIEIEQSHLKVFKHKDKVPVKQFFALYAINKISTIANEN
jgi:hypothetical protein